MNQPALAGLTPATRSQRVVARLMAGGVLLGVYVLALLVMFLFGEDGFGLLLYMLLMVGSAAAFLWLMLAKAKTPGYHFQSLVAVDEVTGQPSGGKLFLRNLLQSVIAMVSCGIAEPIVSYVSFDGSSTWFDRTVGLRVVTVDSLEGRSGGSLGALTQRPTAHRVGSESPSSGGVVPVSAPQDGEPADRTQLVDGGDASPRSSGTQGWQNVQSQHAPIQQVPGSVPSAPAQPPPPPVAAVSAPPAPPQSSDGTGFISGLPFSSGASTPAGPVEPRSAPGGTPSAQAPAPLQPIAEVSDQTVADVDSPDVLTPMLRFDDGEQHLLGPVTVLGRAPVAPAEHPAAVTLAVTDQTMKVSKTHALITVDGDTVRLTDLGATNGVRVARGGQVAERLDKGAPFDLVVGDTVHIGGRTFEVSW